MPLIGIDGAEIGEVKVKVSWLSTIGHSSQTGYSAPRSVVGFDTNGDGRLDAFDTNGDGQLDIRTGESAELRAAEPTEPAGGSGGPRRVRTIKFSGESATVAGDQPAVGGEESPPRRARRGVLKGASGGGDTAQPVSDTAFRLCYHCLSSLRLCLSLRCCSWWYWIRCESGPHYSAGLFAVSHCLPLAYNGPSRPQDDDVSPAT